MAYKLEQLLETAKGDLAKATGVEEIDQLKGIIGELENVIPKIPAIKEEVEGKLRKRLEDKPPFLTAEATLSLAVVMMLDANHTLVADIIDEVGRSLLRECRELDGINSRLALGSALQDEPIKA